jgi:hypothetical protein
MLFCKYVLSLSRCEPFLRSASVGQGAVIDRRVFASVNVLYSLSSAKNSATEFKTQICNKV